MAHTKTRINPVRPPHIVQYRAVSGTGLKVSRICLGTNNFGGQLDEESARRVIDKSLELGINFLDTANVYTQGRSEEVIGKSLKGRREEVTLATKVGYPAQPDGSSDLSREAIMKNAEGSLRRLQTDRIDIYYMHAFDSRTPLAESLTAMDGLVKAGKVKHYAVSNFSVDQLRSAFSICEKQGLEKPVALQPVYNLLSREAEADLLPYCRDRGLSVFTYSPLAGGLLTGKYAAGASPPAGSRAAFRPAYWERISKEEHLAAVERMKAVAEEEGATLGQLSIAWILRNPTVTAPIVGASTPAQVAENCRAVELDVSMGYFDALERAARGE